jgi:hypothetical protein
MSGQIFGQGHIPVQILVGVIFKARKFALVIFWIRYFDRIIFKVNYLCGLYSRSDQVHIQGHWKML